MYNAYKSSVDVSNQLIATNPIDYKTKRKQNRLLFAHIEIYALINTRIIFLENKHLWGTKKSKKTFGPQELRAELYSAWSQEFMNTNLYKTLNDNK